MSPRLERRITAYRMNGGMRAPLPPLYRRFAAPFRRHHLFLTPTTPHGAPPADTTVHHTRAMTAGATPSPNTLPSNLNGLPAASLPLRPDHGGLPVGLQVVGPKFAERAAWKPRWKFGRWWVRA